MSTISRRKFITNVGKGVSLAAILPYLNSFGISSDKELPNIIIIFTDDLGYADIGSFGAKGYSTPSSAARLQW